MSTHSKSRKRARTADDGGSGIGGSSRPDRWTPLPPTPRAAPVTAAQGTTPRRPKPHGRRKWPGMKELRQSGQRCCLACGGGEAMGQTGPRARCSACDGEYHLGCLDPPRAYAPKRGWVCGVCSATALGSSNPRTRKKKQQQQQQQQPQQQGAGATAPRSRFVDVACSALARLSSLSDGGRGGSCQTAAAEQRAPGVVGTVAATAGAAAAAAPAPAPATNRAVALSAGQSRDKRDAAHMTNSVLAWALKSVGGSGEEGKTRQSQSAGGSKGGGGGPDVYHNATEGSGGRESRPLSSAAEAERRGDRRKRGGGARSESEGSFESFGSTGDDGFSPEFWEDGEEDEAHEEDVVMNDASDDDSDGGDGVYDFGNSDGEDPTQLEDAGGSDADAANARPEREKSCSDSDSDSDNDSSFLTRAAESRAGITASSRAPAHGGSGTSAEKGQSNSSAAVVAPGSESEGDGEEQTQKKKRGFWDKDENTRFLEGVAKYGDAWARHAQRHQETGVVVVDQESDYDDDDDEEEDSRDDFGGGGDGDEELDARPAPAGREASDQQRRQKKKRGKGKRTRKAENKNEKAGLGVIQLNRDLRWDEDEHRRFVEGFEKHGRSWAEVARVVLSRNEDQVSRYALRWVDDDGHVRAKTSSNNTGRWEDDEHERFLEGVKKFGRSFRDVAIVVGTRSLEQVKKHARHASSRSSVGKSQNAKAWDKEEHERFLEAVAKHGRSWAAVAQAVGTRDRVQVCDYAKAVLNGDLSPKTAAPAPAPASSPAKRSDGASVGNVMPPRAAAAAAAAAASAPAPPTSARAATNRETIRPPRRRQAAAATAAAEPNPRAAVVATPGVRGGGGGGGGGGGASAAGVAGAPANTGKEPSSVAVVEAESGDEDGDGDGDGDSYSRGNGGLGPPAPVVGGGEANEKRGRPKETRRKQQQKESKNKSLGRIRLQQDLQWDWVEHKRFVEGVKKHGRSWAEVARVVRSRNEDQVSRYALRWVDDDGHVRAKTSNNNTGRWGDDEHERFLEGVKKFGRSFRDVAIVVGTRSLEQVKKRARAELVKEHVVPKRKRKSKPWDKEEHERFLEAFAEHGRDWVAVARAVGTRDRNQVNSHALAVLKDDLSPKTDGPAPASTAKRSAASAAVATTPRGDGGTHAPKAPRCENEPSSALGEAESKYDSRDKDG